MKIQHLFSFTIILFSTILCSSCIKVHIDNIKLNKTELVLSPGYSEKLIATIYPEDADNKKVTWRSSDSTIISVNDDGLVTAIKDGEAIITASTENGKKTATCSVIVDYRNKWIGDYWGEYITQLRVTLYPPNPPDTTMVTLNVSIYGDSSLLIKKGKVEWKMVVEESGYFFYRSDMIDPSAGFWDGNIINENMSFSGTLSQSSGHIKIHSFKGKRQ